MAIVNLPLQTTIPGFTAGTLPSAATTYPTAPTLPTAGQMGTQEQQYMTNALAGYAGTPVIQSQLAGQFSPGAMAAFNRMAAERGLGGTNVDASLLANILNQTEALQQQGVQNLNAARATVPALNPLGLSQQGLSLYQTQMGDVGANVRAQLAAQTGLTEEQMRLATQTQLAQQQMAASAQLQQQRTAAEQASQAAQLAAQQQYYQQQQAQQAATNAALQDIVTRYGAGLVQPGQVGTAGLLTTPTTPAPATPSGAAGPVTSSDIQNERDYLEMQGFSPEEIDMILSSWGATPQQLGGAPTAGGGTAPAAGQAGTRDELLQAGYSPEEADSILTSWGAPQEAYEGGFYGGEE